MEAAREVDAQDGTCIIQANPDPRQIHPNPKKKKKKTHQLFSQSSQHDFGEGVHGKYDDLTRPRITQYTVTKAYEHVDPMDPLSAKTGNVMYAVEESTSLPTA